MNIESYILDDSEMTQCIKRHLKGDFSKKECIIADWFNFTFKAFLKSLDISAFLKDVNKWLKHYQLPITVTNFEGREFICNDNIGEMWPTVEWHIDILKHD